MSTAEDAVAPDDPDEIENDRLSQQPSREVPNLEQTASNAESVHAAKEKEQETSLVLHNLAVYASLTIFSIAGAATRVGITALTTYDGQPVFGVLAAQAIGCAVMGFAVRNRQYLESLDPVLYIGIGTGFCGSTTTFSTWMFQTFQAFSNNEGARHSGLKNATSGITQLYVTLAIATASLRFGVHTATLIRTSWNAATKMHAPLASESKESLKTSNLPSRQKPLPKSIANILRCFLVSFAILVWLCVILLAVYEERHRYFLLALVLAPPGCFLRFLLARLNVKHPSFPRGTFVANVLACALDAVVYLLQRTGAARSNTLGCSALQGVADGICGCLSTVSTFAVEIRGLKRRHAYLYAGSSILAGQAIFVLLYGSYWWSQGLEAPCAFNNI